MCGEAGARDVGLLVGGDHANAFGQSLHGGALMSFADAAFSIAVGDAEASPCSVTAHLQTQFVAAAQVGDLLQCTPEVIRQTRDLVSVRSLPEHLAKNPNHPPLVLSLSKGAGANVVDLRSPAARRLGTNGSCKCDSQFTLAVLADHIRTRTCASDPSWRRSHWQTGKIRRDRQSCRMTGNGWQALRLHSGRDRNKFPFQGA